MPKPYTLSEILPALVKHGMKHEQEMRQSNSEVIRQRAFLQVEEARKHIEKVLFHPNTRSFSGKNNQDFFYNSEHKTFVVINPNKDPDGKIYGGTFFRGINDDRSERTYLRNIKLEAQRLGKKPVEHEKNGIVALQPEISKEFAQDYLQKQGQNLTTFKKAEITPQRPEANHPRIEKSLNTVKPSPDLIKQQSHKRAR